MVNKEVNGIVCYAPESRKALIDFAFHKKGILVAINAEKILHATEESRAIINENVGYPDGMGAVWALRQKGCKHVIKIPGCELWLDIVDQYHDNKTFYLIGGKETVIQKTVQQLTISYPSIKIANFRNGYFQNEAEKVELIQDILEKKPDVVFVAMGSPKQELVMEELHHHHPAVYQGLGGSFDIYTGHAKRAPKWWVQNELEWAYRLMKQPTRIIRQMHLLKYLWKLKTGRL